MPDDGSAELPFHYNPSSMPMATGALHAQPQRQGQRHPRIDDLAAFAVQEGLI